MRRTRSVLRSPKKRIEDKARAKKLLVLCGCAVCAVLVAIPLVSRISYFKITKIVAAGNTTIDSEKIKGVVLEQLSGNWMWVFPKTNAYMVNANRLETQLRQSLPQLAAVSVTRNGMHELHVSVTEREPEALWCEENGGCFFVDVRGEVYAPAPAFSAGVYVRFRGGMNAAEPIIGSVIYPNSFAAILSLSSRLKELGATITDVSEATDGEYHLMLAQGGVIRISLQDSIETTYSRIHALLSDQHAVPDTKQFFDSIEYLDVRFGNKIFLKQK
jgi:cell division septal protein FtsQ